MAKYKLIKKVNPQKRQEPDKWYTTPKSKTPLSGEAITCATTANTTAVPIEMKVSLELLAKFVPQQPQRGHTMKIPGLGTFRLTFKSDSVEDIDNLRVNNMIKNVRIIFTPSKELRESVLSGPTFEDGSMLRDDISYASIADYHLAKGVPKGGGGSESPGEI